MAQKKRGTNPIRITLTEDQISDIIQSAAKTRRGLKVESLEDRIAPSAIGAPMFDPGLTGDAPPSFNPDGSPLPGLPGEPPLPGPTGPMGMTEGPSTPPDPAGIYNDPSANLPGSSGPPGMTEGPAPQPDGLPGGPVLPFNPADGTTPPNPSDMSAPGAFRFHHQQGGGGPIPSDLAGPSDPTVDGPVDPQAYQQANHLIQNQVRSTIANGGTMPTADEIEEHRRNILRQLRGN